MTEARLPAHLEVNALVRRVNAEGGFATVLHKGEPDAGTILIVLTNSAEPSRLYERMPNLAGDRKWERVRTADPEKVNEFNDLLARRSDQDQDIWILELDIPNGERFIL